MLRNAVVVIEGLLIGLLVLFLAMTVFDLPYAWHAQPCSIERSSGCYPWGASAVGFVWTYASENYLVWSVFSGRVVCCSCRRTPATARAADIRTAGRRSAGLPEPPFPAAHRLTLIP